MVGCCQCSDSVLTQCSSISASFAIFEPCKSHAIHRDVATTVVSLSHRHR